MTTANTFITVKTLDNGVVLKLRDKAAKSVLGMATRGETFKEIVDNTVKPYILEAYNYRDKITVVMKRGKTDRSNVYVKVTH